MLDKMPSHASKIDFTGPSHHLRPYDGAKRLVVFFGAKDLSFEKYNFFQTGRELPEHCLFLNNGVNHWYQYGVPGVGADFATTVDAIKHWRDVLGVEEVLTIGTSMGGYGAIQYGAALNARVLAFATDARLMDKHSQSSRHFIKEGPPSCPDLCELLAKTPTDVTLFAGERDAVDLHSASQFNRIDCVRAISLIGSDHILPTYLSRQARLVPLLRSFVAGNGIPHQPDAGDALTCHGYVENAFAAFDATQEQDWTRCEAAARSALEAYPHGEAANLLLGRALLQQDRVEDALMRLAVCSASQPDDIEAKTLLALALRRVGARAQARHVYDQILLQKPGSHRSWYALCILALDAGDLHAALSAGRKAAKIFPSSKLYQDRVENIEARLGMQKTPDHKHR